MSPEPPRTDTPAAGWYPDPENSGMQRHWDGSQWTDDRRPLSAPEVSGRLLFFGYAGALFLPIVGLILGIVLLAKKATLVISIGVTALAFAITPSEEGESQPSGANSLERLEERASKAESKLDKCLAHHSDHAARRCALRGLP